MINELTQMLEAKINEKFDGEQDIANRRLWDVNTLDVENVFRDAFKKISDINDKFNKAVVGEKTDTHNFRVKFEKSIKKINSEQLKKAGY